MNATNHMKAQRPLDTASIITTILLNCRNTNNKNADVGSAKRHKLTINVQVVQGHCKNY